jgi:hypothetical protein
MAFKFSTRPQLIEAVALLCPGANFRSDQNPTTGEYDYEHLHFDIPAGSSYTPPSKEVVMAYLTKIQAEWDEGVKYSMLRKVSYPDVGAQLDALWHAMDEGTLTKVDEFYDMVKAVKDQFPKNDPTLPWRGSALGTIRGENGNLAIDQNSSISLPDTTYPFNS